jgi:hypothetical protein
LVPRAAVPSWRAGTPAVLSVSGQRLIPVSTAHRAGDDRIVFALGRGRETLARLRRDRRCALCVLAEGVAFTAEGTAVIAREQMTASDRVAALELSVERVHDHLADGRTVMLAAAAWRWVDEGDASRDAAVNAELAELAGGGV